MLSISKANKLQNISIFNDAFCANIKYLGSGDTLLKIKFLIVIYFLVTLIILKGTLKKYLRFLILPIKVLLVYTSSLL